ncbi:MAG: hypothetical protein B9S32_00450 [Verrucomicrobia bacterium Tous-C9LFEB]|nr:MAG: hypothetical protein B9S32_00450 [Verrucomicrobia bacterium Tous-C9LFEB]
MVKRMRSTMTGLLLGVSFLVVTVSARAYSLNFLSKAEPGKSVATFDFARGPEPARDKLSLSEGAVLSGSGVDRVLTATSSGKTEWNVICQTSVGLLQAEKRYRVSVDYSIPETLAEDNYAYLKIRSEAPGGRWRPLPVLEGKAGVAQHLAYEFLTGAESDCTIGVGLHGRGAIAVKRVEIEELPLLSGLDHLEPGEGTWSDVLGVCAHLDWRHFYTSDEQIGRTLDLLQKMGAGWVRMGFSWDQIFPSRRGQADPETMRRLRLIVKEVNRRKMHIVVIVNATPRWASSNPLALHAWRYPARDLSDYEDYVRFLSREFKGQVRDWEIGNETNWPMFWMGSFADYLRELHAASKILRSSDPKNRILCAGLTDAGLHGMKGSYRGALADLMAPENASAYDILSLHYYPGMAEEALYAVNGVTALMREKGAVKPIWMTETGYSVANGRTLEQQTRMHEKLIPLLAAHPAIERVFIYNERVKDFESDPYERGFGLLEADFTPRPVYGRLKELFQQPPPRKIPALDPKIVNWHLSTWDLCN